MEFTNLGSQCGESSCRQLDFLPLRCDACSGMFCSSHHSYETHSCPQRHTKDVQVPVCPLCDLPVPVRRGSPPDAAVWAHMDSSECGAQQTSKKTAGDCAVRKCKNREPIPFKCSSCQQTVCISHRHQQDHPCSKDKSSLKNTSSIVNRTSQTQSQIDQDQLLALALSREDNSRTSGASNPSTSSSSNKACRVS
uniref:AN1-type zinc finger protein 2B n=1 Tax=Caligus clemensi TaxID=344056 RepID=C1C1A3_CALCM|nr:AN1-type zinc finger protein 2B [Caligus clemensi]